MCIYDNVKLFESSQAETCLTRYHVRTYSQLTHHVTPQAACHSLLPTDVTVQHNSNNYLKQASASCGQLPTNMFKE